MNALTIADVAIRTDAEGRYCLNDLHRAAVASGVTKDIRPNEWMALSQTSELAESLITENPGNSPISTTAGRYGGTFVAKELVYAYAMWISPAFHLRVIRAYDAMMSQPQPDPMAVLNDPAAMRGLLLTYADKVIALEHKVAEDAPKVVALERFADHSGHHNTRNAAKLLGIGEKMLVAWLLAHRWYYRDHSGRLCAYGDKIAMGYLDTKPIDIRHSDYTETRPQPVITQRGLVRLGETLAKEGRIPKKPTAELFQQQEKEPVE